MNGTKEALLLEVSHQTDALDKTTKRCWVKNINNIDESVLVVIHQATTADVRGSTKNLWVQALIKASCVKWIKWTGSGMTKLYKVATTKRIADQTKEIYFKILNNFISRYSEGTYTELAFFGDTWSKLTVFVMDATVRATLKDVILTACLFIPYNFGFNLMVSEMNALVPRPSHFKIDQYKTYMLELDVLRQQLQNAIQHGSLSTVVI
jgi:hypothetical protein